MNAKRMEHTISAQLLLILGQYFDYRERVSSVPRALRALAGDPRFHRHRQWIEESLRKRQKLYQSIYNLKRRNYLQDKVFGKTRSIMLTPMGVRKVAQLRKRAAYGKQKLPYGKWLMVFFDIPEERRRQRDALRWKLRWLGFEPLQKSVWVTANDVRGELVAWIWEHRVQVYVRLLLVKEWVL